MDIPQGTPPIVAMLVGEIRFYDIDTSNDGGLPVGTVIGDVALAAADEYTGANAPSMVAGGLVSVTGNVVRVKIAAIATGTYRITLTYTNAYGQPCKCFWRFKVV